MILEFADALAKKPDPDDVGAPPPDFRKANNLYRRALEIEIGRDLRDSVMFKSARAIQEAGFIPKRRTMDYQIVGDPYCWSHETPELPPGHATATSLAG